jgi:hypothetical protein
MIFHVFDCMQMLLDFGVLMAFMALFDVLLWPGTRALIVALIIK